MPAQPDPSGVDQGPDLHQPEVHASLERYWKSNVRVTLVLLAIWAVAGLGCGVLFADQLNAYRLPGTGYPLGFWFAQQGSIIVFVLLILAYCIFMNRLDRKHHDELEALRGNGGAGQ
jgi:putative solute:sodium symporter small subunit